MAGTVAVATPSPSVRPNRQIRESQKLEIIYAAMTRAGQLGIGHAPSEAQYKHAKFHLDALLQEEYSDSPSQLAMELAARLLPIYPIERKRPIERSRQVFMRGDLVHCAGDFPSNMEHFEGRGEVAIVAGSYVDRYGGCVCEREGDRCHAHRSYSLVFPTINGKLYNSTISWYDEHLLTLLEPRNLERLDILDGPK